MYGSNTMLKHGVKQKYSNQLANYSDNHSIQYNTNILEQISQRVFDLFADKAKKKPSAYAEGF